MGLIEWAGFQRICPFTYLYLKGAGLYPATADDTCYVKKENRATAFAPIEKFFFGRYEVTAGH